MKVRLGDLTLIKTGRLDANRAAEDGKYPFFTCAVEPLRINQYAYDCECVLVAGNGDLNVKYYKGKFNAYQRTYIVESNTEDLYVPYLYRFLSQYIRVLRRRSIGGVIKYIKLGHLSDAEIPLPPLLEQKRIAAILDKADEIRRKREEALRLSDEFLRSVFLDMFGDPVINRRNWASVPLREAVRKGADVTYGIVQAGPECEGGVPYIRTGDIKNGEIVVEGLRHTSPEIAAKFKRSEVESGDIVMSIRATVGTTAVVPEELAGANLTQGTAVIRPGEAKLHYLLHYLRSTGAQTLIRRQVKGATFREITLTRLREIPVLLPPSDTQDEFGRICAKHSGLLKKLCDSRDEADSLFRSLQQRAFKGEL